MSYAFNCLLSLSVSFGAIIGWIRFRRTDPAFFPFLWLLWLGLFNELLSIALIRAGYPNAINYNVYGLAESVLLVLQFKNWGLFGVPPRIYFSLQCLLVAGWIAANFILSTIFTINSYFTIGRSIALVVLSLFMLHELFSRPVRWLLRQPIFLICLGLIVLFTYTTIVEAFWLCGLRMSHTFQVYLYEIFVSINLFTNFIFAFAALWMPMKRRYLLRC